MTVHVLVVWRQALNSLGRDFAGVCSHGWEDTAWDADGTLLAHSLACGTPTSVRRGEKAAKALTERRNLAEDK